MPPKQDSGYWKPVQLKSELTVTGSMPRFCDHEGKATHFMWPFWVVRRSVSGAGTNCKLQWVTVNTVHTGSEKSILPEAVVDAYDVTLPVLINTEDVRKGDELVCHWPVADTAPPKRNLPKYTVSTWAS